MDLPRIERNPLTAKTKGSQGNSKDCPRFGLSSLTQAWKSTSSLLQAWTSKKHSRSFEIERERALVFRATDPFFRWCLSSQLKGMRSLILLLFYFWSTILSKDLLYLQPSSLFNSSNSTSIHSLSRPLSSPISSQRTAESSTSKSNQTSFERPSFEKSRQSSWEGRQQQPQIWGSKSWKEEFSSWDEEDWQDEVFSLQLHL